MGRCHRAGEPCFDLFEPGFNLTMARIALTFRGASVFMEGGHEGHGLFLNEMTPPGRKMFARLVAAAAALACALSLLSPAHGQGRSLPAAPPKLIVAISVDQFSADLFAEYRAYFQGGLKRLSTGAVFPSGFQGHAATETCPGHSTILTGDRPERTGIIANNWYDFSAKREDKLIYCAEDEEEPGTDSGHYIASAKHLRVPTLGDRMKVADPATRVVSVAGKDRAALMMGGRNTDQLWWWGGKSFVTLKGRPSDPVVERANAAIASRMAAAQKEMLLPPVCVAHDYPVAVGGRTVGTGRFARVAGDAKAFRASPELDASTLDLAAALREEMKLGEQAQTDLLIIGASATDYVGHGYGTEGTEMCLQLMALDRLLGAFFDRLDAVRIDYVVVLTADHGGHDIPERHDMNAAPMAARVSVGLNAGTLSKTIGAKLRLSGQLLYGDGPNGDYYVGRALPKARRAAVLAEAERMLRHDPQVAGVFTRKELAAMPRPTGTPDTWSLGHRARMSFDAERSGDLVVLLKPRITPIADATQPYIATHGSPWDYDRRVPILFWRKGLHPFEQPLPVETVDIVPTLSAMIGLDLAPGEVDGRCLDLNVGQGDMCAGR